MANNKDIAIGVTALATVAALIALFADWWTSSTPLGEGLGSFSTGYGPFDSEADDSGKGLIAGLLTLAALVALIAATVIMLVPRLNAGKPNPVAKYMQYAPWLTIGAGGVLALALLLAVFTWPENGLSFWDKVGTTTFGAGFGFYVAIVSVLAAVVGAVLWMKATGTTKTVPRTA